MKTLLGMLLVAALLLSLAAMPVLAQGTQSVELHGYMQNRFYANPDRPARFVTERISLSAVGHIAPDTTGYLEVYFHPWLTDRTVAAPTNPPASGYTAEQFRNYVESAYVDMPLSQGRIRFGKGRQLNFGLTPAYPNRKTTQYGILAETFTQDRIIGAQYDQKFGTFDVGASVYTDQRVENRKIGDFAGADVSQLMSSLNVVAHIVDKDDPANNPGMLAYCARVGVTKPNYQVHVSGAVGRMVTEDVKTLAGAFLPVGADVPGSRDHNKYGVDASYSFGPGIIQGEAYQGNFSFVTVTGYSVLVGYQPKDKTRFYARWAAINNDKTPTANQLTWSPQQLTIGVVQPIRKGVWVEVDYEKNMESTGAGVKEPNNDMLFAEVFTGF